MLPSAPLYIVSKGRWESRLTAKALDRMGVDYRVVVEHQEHRQYAAVIDPDRLLVLDPSYKRRYETCDDLGNTKGYGPGPARNFAWDHAVASGAAWHWVMDDNIQWFYRMNRNARYPVFDGAYFRAMEDFCDRYENVGMAGPCYQFFAPMRDERPPFILNTRIYSCNLIRNDVPFRWRGRYNEDTILSLDMLKAGWCTVQFYAFLQRKAETQTLGGGNTAEFYAVEGTRPKSEMLARVHPDVARVTEKYGRVHHHVDYRPFKRNRLRLKPGIDLDALPPVDEYGMVLTRVKETA